jgi:hypothetical protein
MQCKIRHAKKNFKPPRWMSVTLFTNWGGHALARVLFLVASRPSAAGRQTKKLAGQPNREYDRRPRPRTTGEIEKR